MSEKHLILEEPIRPVDASVEFHEMCKINGFKNLGDILELTVNDMLIKPEFNYRILKELYQILERYNLTEYIKE